MSYTIPDIVFLFFIYSFVGWLWETVYCSILDKHFVYRGFLVGPYCPVYGFAVTTVLLSTEPIQTNLLALFVGGLLIATVFEYLAGWLLETFFHMKLWDYSHEPGNIKGRIAPRISLFWGFGVVILVHFIQPVVMDLVLRFNDWWALLIALIMTGDFIWTVTDTVKFRQAALSLENRIRGEQERLEASARGEVEDLAQQAEFLSQRLEQFRQHLEEFLQEKDIKPFRFNQRRILRNYSKIRLEDAPLIADLRKQVAHFRKPK